MFTDEAMIIMARCRVPRSLFPKKKKTWTIRFRVDSSHKTATVVKLHNYAGCFQSILLLLLLLLNSRVRLSLSGSGIAAYSCSWISCIRWRWWWRRLLRPLYINFFNNNNNNIMIALSYILQHTLQNILHTHIAVYFINNNIIYIIVIILIN